MCVVDVESAIKSIPQIQVCLFVYLFIDKELKFLATFSLCDVL